MASIDPSFISKKIWVDEISKIFNHQLKIDSESLGVSIFRVPESITTQKPQCYEPQHIGLGPYYHFHPRLYEKMESEKLVAMQRVLKKHKFNDDFEVFVLHKVLRLVPKVRQCYHNFLQDNNDSLAWVFTMDGLFLLDLFREYKLNEIRESRARGSVDLPIEEAKSSRGKFPSEKRLLAQDLMMLDNQIPFIVLEEISTILSESSDDSIDLSNYFSPIMVRSFADIHSPFKLCPRPKAGAQHLLDYVYKSIVDDIPITDPDDFRRKLLPQEDEIVEIYQRAVTILETFSQSNTVIPSASKLHKRVGFTFHKLGESNGIQNITVDKNKNEIHLPWITLYNDSEVTLRNLVVYETSKLNTKNYPVTEFMVLMCALIMNVNDVKLLQEAKIIEGSLKADDVVKLFISLSNSIPSITNKEDSKFQKIVKDINSVYESMLMTQIVLFLMKIANWLLVVLKAIGGCVEASWKNVLFIASIVTISMLIWKWYCDTFGCANTKMTFTLARF